MSTPRPVYRCGDRAVPPPPALAHLVRSPQHFSRILSAVVGRLGNGEYHGREQRMAQEMARRFGRNLADRGAARLLLALWPPVPCPTCGRPFFPGGGNRVHCSVACRRRVERAAGRRGDAA